MKKNKLIVLFLLCLLVFTCVACSKETNRETEPFTNSSEEQEETDIDQPEETPGSIDEGAVTGSDAWKALTFTLDGNTISLPADYSAFENTGWSIDPEETDTSEQLETGSGTLRVWLYNDSYSTEDVSMNIQFFNLDEETKQLLDSEVHVFDLRIEPGASSYPDLELPEGITWGATVDEIYEAYGN